MHRNEEPTEAGATGNGGDAAGRACARWWWVVPMVLMVVHCVWAVPIILNGTMTGRWGEDQINYHEPAVRRFAQELPMLNVGDYLSATTPGYHVIVAGLSRVTGDSQATLQLLGMLFTIALLAVFGTGVAWRYVGRNGDMEVRGSKSAESRRTAVLMALAVCLPLVCSMYVFQAGVWLLPDNAGWLGVLVVMLLALRFRVGVGTLVAGCAAMVGLVMCRQIHIWAAGLLWASAWLSVQERAHSAGSMRDLVTFPTLRFRRAMLAVVATVPAFGVLVMFYQWWGGLTPPTFQGQYKGFNPAAPVFILAVLGVVSVFFVGFIAEGLWSLLTRNRLALGVAMVVGLIVSVVPTTSFSVEEGRFSGLWKVAEKMPLIADHVAPGMVVLAVLGSVMAAAWFVSLPWRERWFFLAALCGFTLAQSASFQIWQRYSEPFVLMLVALLSSSVRGACTESERATSGEHGKAMPAARMFRMSRVGGPVLLAVLLVGLAYLTMRRAPQSVLHGADFLPQVQDGTSKP